MGKKKYIFNKLEWVFACPPDGDFSEKHLRSNAYVQGPFCSRCHMPMFHEMEVPIESPFEVRASKKKLYKVVCSNCQFSIETRLLTKSYLKTVAHAAFHAQALSHIETISLDLPPTKLKTKDSDERFFLRTELTQKEGRLVGVVYIGEKLDKQTDKDKAQLFIDIDQQQVRFDTNNKNPGQLLAKFECEFKGASSKMEFKKHSE